MVKPVISATRRAKRNGMNRRPKGQPNCWGGVRATAIIKAPYPA
jgi:hypothetical protein